MGYSNYPDGMRESDIPGYNDIECPECVDGINDDDESCDYCGGSGVVDSREYNKTKHGEYWADRDYDDRQQGW